MVGIFMHAMIELLMFWIFL